MGTSTCVQVPGFHRAWTDSTPLSALPSGDPTKVRGWSPSAASGRRVVGDAELAQEGVANSVRFAGRSYDTETGLYYNRARYYDPALGSYNAHYQRVVIHHEFFHMVDERMKLLNIDPEWYFDPVGRPAQPAGMREAIAQMRASGTLVGNFTHTH